MQMLTRERSKDENSVTGQGEELGENPQGYALEKEAQLTKNMNKATAQLKLLSVDGEQDMEEDEEECDDAMDREVDSKEETPYAVHRSDSPSLLAGLNPDSDNEGGKDFLEDDLSVHLEDNYLSKDYDSSSEVASGVFDASHANLFEEPKSFKEHLWNLAGPSVGSMSIFLNLLKDNLEEDKAGFPAGFSKIPQHLLTLLAEEAGKDRRDQIEYAEEILKALNKIGQTNSHEGAPTLDEGSNQEASKTQGTLPGAHQASPTEAAAVEPATPAGRDKEGVQSLSMAPTG
jgi:hypothetical protein